MPDIEPKAVTQLNLTQQIALKQVYEEVALARRQLARAQGRFNAVARECGLDPEVNYNITPDGVVHLIVSEAP